MINRKKKNNKGFTLVELLVVIAIIGILAVVAVPTLFKQIDKGRVADIHSNVSSIKSAAMAYYADNGTMPTLQANGTANTDLVVSKYLDSTPDKDSMKYVVSPTDNGDCQLEVIGIKANDATYVKNELLKTYGNGSAVDSTTEDGGKIKLTYTLIKK